MQPNLGGFNAAFTTSEARTKEARRLDDLEYRYNRRYRLWEQPPGTGDETLDRLGNRRRAAIEVAEDAAHRLRILWDDLSCRLRPFGVAHGQMSVAVYR